MLILQLEYVKKVILYFILVNIVNKFKIDNMNGKLIIIVKISSKVVYVNLEYGLQ